MLAAGTAFSYDRSRTLWCTEQVMLNIKQLDGIAWSLFLIWVGIALATELTWAWFLLGVGILILAVQFVRWHLDMRIEGFWVASGVVFLAGSLWKLFDLAWPVAPVLLILLGVASLGRAVVGGR